MVKCLSIMRKTWVQSLGQEGLLEKEIATHSSIFAWKTLWMEDPGGLQSMGSQRVRHNWVTSLSFFLSALPQLPFTHFTELILLTGSNLPIVRQCNTVIMTSNSGVRFPWVQSQICYLSTVVASLQDSLIPDIPTLELSCTSLNQVWSMWLMYDYGG